MPEARWSGVEVQKHPLPELPERTRIVGRAPPPDGRRYSQWGNTEAEAWAGAARFGLTPDMVEP